MAPAKTPRRLKPESDYGNVGVKGRYVMAGKTLGLYLASSAELFEGEPVLYLKIPAYGTNMA